MFSYYILILFLIGPSAAGLICNRDTEHQCVCEAGSLPPSPPPNCEDFLQTAEMDVIDMRARRVNLEAQLHSSENYESYFKRRIAQIVSSYCENEVNECPGVSLKITKTDARMSDENFVLYAVDENDPLLTQDNVILLKVEKETGNVTRIQFVIVKTTNIGKIRPDDIVDPNKVKVILGSQAVPLSRILGGIRLENVRVTRIHRELGTRGNDGDNTKLIWMISCVGAFFAICYLIGGYRLWKLHQNKKSRSKTETECLAASSATPNYGTLNREKPSRNGSVKTKRQELEAAAYESEYRSIDETVPEVDPNEPRHLTARQARFMFMCDASQLPREPTFDSTTELDKGTEQKGAKMAAAAIREEEEAPLQNETIPELVIVSSNSMIDSTPIVSPCTEEEGVDYLRSDSPEVERPTSRRGSRVDEEDIDLTEIGIQKEPMFTDLVVPDEIEPHMDRPDSAEKWSSSEGEVDIYYKMSDDEELKRDDWNARNNNKEEHEEEESENEEDPIEKPKEEDFVYERLREEVSSPQFPQSDN